MTAGIEARVAVIDRSLNGLVIFVLFVNEFDDKILTRNLRMRKIHDGFSANSLPIGFVKGQSLDSNQL